MKPDTRESAFGRIKPVHPYAWGWEPLASEPSSTKRAMLSAKAVYLGSESLRGPKIEC